MCESTRHLNHRRVTVNQHPSLFLLLAIVSKKKVEAICLWHVTITHQHALPIFKGSISQSVDARNIKHDHIDRWLCCGGKQAAWKARKNWNIHTFAKREINDSLHVSTGRARQSLLNSQPRLTESCSNASRTEKKENLYFRVGNERLRGRCRWLEGLRATSRKDFSWKQATAAWTSENVT